MPNYIRDKRSPVPKSETVSHVMSRNRAKDTKPELTLRKALWQANLRGYRLHKRIALKNSPPYEGGVDPDEIGRRGGSLRGAKTSVKNLKNHPVTAAMTPLLRKEGSLLSKPRRSSVRPDIAFIGRKLAIFVHGCFWHRCPKCSTSLPEHNTPFWKAMVAGLPQHWRVL